MGVIKLLKPQTVAIAWADPWVTYIIIWLNVTLSKMAAITKTKGLNNIVITFWVRRI